jgi:hypothetical protein
MRATAVVTLRNRPAARTDRSERRPAQGAGAARSRTPLDGGWRRPRRHWRPYSSDVRRHPNDWPDAQRAFREAIESGSHVAPERAVIAVWWRPATGPRGEVRIACYDPADISGEQPLVVFPADAPYPADEGTSPAQLIGEVGLNATCCLRLHGSLVWPSYNPVTHGSPAPPHDRPPADLRGRTWAAATAVVVGVALAVSLLGYLVFPDPRLVVLTALPALVVGQRLAMWRRRRRLRRAINAS